MSTIELVDRQTQALKEVRGFLAAVDAKPFGGVSRSSAASAWLADFHLSGEKACAAVVDAILERHGIE